MHPSPSHTGRGKSEFVVSPSHAGRGKSEFVVSPSPAGRGLGCGCAILLGEGRGEGNILTNTYLKPDHHKTSSGMKIMQMNSMMFI